VKSRINASFRKTLRKLPDHLRRHAKAAYKLFAENPYHPGLHFKKVDPDESIYSVRVGLDYRALGVLENDEITWFWIGPHSDYDKLIS